MKRLRLVRRWKKPARPAPPPCGPRPAQLDNPYGPCYGRPPQLQPAAPEGALKGPLPHPLRLSKKSRPADMCGWTGHIQGN